MRRFVVAPPPAVGSGYSSLILRPEGVAARAASPEIIARVLELIERLEADPFTMHMAEVYRAGLERFGPYFRYLDITTVLGAVADLGHPENYLEIGVRRGRSLAIVASMVPEVALVGFDLWQVGYGNNENPGPDFVQSELARLGHRGSLDLISGDSHVTVPEYLGKNSSATFDIITVDGDHSLDGAWDDLYNVTPRLRVGGVLVFDDTNNPYCPGLRDVWDALVAADGGLLPASFDEVGTGVSFALRARPGATLPRRRPGRRWF
jgi:predicted O-methyltransferase YrrM